MTAALAALLLLAPTQVPGLSEPRLSRESNLPDPEGGESRLSLWIPGEKIPTPVTSPKHGWPFEWVIAGYVRLPDQPGRRWLRFRVFSQERRSQGDPAEPVARMLLRLWDFNTGRLRLDHGEAFRRLVDVYLAFGGQAGGEQLFGEGIENGQRVKVNAIYIYDVRSFTRPLEMAREVAHEYGHATLPPFGRFAPPDEWANGNLGEALYLRWLLAWLREGKLSPADCCGASEEDLAGYVKREVNPRLIAAAQEGPSLPLLARRDAAALDHFLGLALWADSLLPPRAFGRALVLAGGVEPEGLVRGIEEAAAEIPRWTIAFPSVVHGKAVWIPLGKGRLESGSVLARRGAWARVQAGPRPLTVLNPPVE